MGFDRSRTAWFAAADSARWSLPPRGGRRLMVLLGRALTRRCPYSGARGVYRNWWSLRERCPQCGVLFEREEGYLVGVYAVNLIGAEFLGFGIVLALLLASDLSTLAIQIAAIALGIALPVIGYPFAAALWITIDLMLDPPEPALALARAEAAAPSPRTVRSTPAASRPTPAADGAGATSAPTAPPAPDPRVPEP